MAYQTKPDSGSLFPNNRKDTDNHPDMNGKALIGGVWYWISAWDKEGRSGHFQTLAFKEMTPEQAAKENGASAPAAAPARRQVPARANPRPARRPAPQAQDDYLDDIPF